MGTLTLPAKGRITQEYTTSHRAVDFGWGEGTEVYAAAAGTISYEKSAGGYGKRLTINHGKLVGIGSRTRYAHLSKAVVTSGTVEQGQLIGYMGNTGYYSKAVHLHFELEVNFGAGYAKVNPTQYFTDTAGGGTTPLPVKKKEIMATIVQNKETTQAALVDATTFQPLSKARVAVERRLWGGTYVQLSQEEWDLLQNARQPAAPTVPGTPPVAVIDYAAIAKAVNDDAAKRLVN